APLPAAEIVPTIDRITEDVHDAAQQTFAYGDPERMTGVDDGRSASEAGRWGQRDASDGFGIEMTDDFDDDATFVSGSQLAVELREVTGEAGVHHAASYRENGASTKVPMIVHT